jgi:arylsulfatase A-like enzyme
MTLPHLTRTLCALALLGGLFSRSAVARPAEPARPPNVVLIFADDLGYADLGCYGAEGIETPNLDRLAKEGTRFTDFYVAQAVCSASRAALLTGCYSNRVGIQGALGPGSKIGINASEVTLAELLKSRGYATAIYGKWHLGDAPQFLPTRHGFDEYFGLPYSNDMWPNHPTSKNYPPLPLIEGEKVRELNPDQRNLTTWYTEHAVSFIEQNKARPFFLYVPHSMPHVPLFVSDKWKGKSKRGLFGDVIQELDWSVGQITAALDRNGLDRNTLVIFASDNGPWLSYGDHAGSAKPLREGKGTSFEGGVREPAIFRWRGKIPAGGVCREPAMTIDVLPTLARLAGAQVPADRIIDGKDIWPLISSPRRARSPHEALYIYWGGHLDAVRSGKWKLHLPHEYRTLKGPPGTGGLPGPYEQKQIGTALFDLEQDAGETQDLAAGHPDVVRRLTGLAQKAREDLGDTETGQPGTGLRPPGRLAP